MPVKNRSCASYYIQFENQHLIFDIGCGTLRRMAEAGVPYSEIDSVMITHTHPDHVSDLAPFIMALNHTPGLHRTKPLNLYGPAGFTDFINNLKETFGTSLLEPKTFQLNIIEMENESIQNSDYKLTALNLKHSRNTVGYRLEHKHKVFVYSGDTELCDNIIKLAQNADMALLECSAPDHEPLPGHLTISQTLDIAEKAGCKKLILTHFYPAMEEIQLTRDFEKIFSGDIIKAQDFLITNV